jgi:hypothetical protein
MASTDGARLRVVVAAGGVPAGVDAQNALVTARDGLDAGAALPAPSSLDAAEVHIASATELR